MKNNNFISINEAAEILGVHSTTIIHWIKKKKLIDEKKKLIEAMKDFPVDEKNLSKLTEYEKNFRCPPYTRLGSRYRFNREDIENFMQYPIENH